MPLHGAVDQAIALRPARHTGSRPATARATSDRTAGRGSRPRGPRPRAGSSRRLRRTRRPRRRASTGPRSRGGAKGGRSTWSELYQARAAEARARTSGAHAVAAAARAALVLALTLVLTVDRAPPAPLARVEGRGSTPRRRGPTRRWPRTAAAGEASRCSRCAESERQRSAGPGRTRPSTPRGTRRRRGRGRAGSGAPRQHTHPPGRRRGRRHPAHLSGTRFAPPHFALLLRVPSPDEPRPVVLLGPRVGVRLSFRLRREATRA
jgi:hypothetical protein